MHGVDVSLLSGPEPFQTAPGSDERGTGRCYELREIASIYYTRTRFLISYFWQRFQLEMELVQKTCYPLVDGLESYATQIRPRSVN